MKVVLPSGTDSIESLIDGQNRRVGRNQLSPLRSRMGRQPDPVRVRQPANVPDNLAKGGNTYHLINDHPGSVRLVVDTEIVAIAQRIDWLQWLIGEDK